MFSVNSQVPQVTITQTDPEIAYGKTIIARRDQGVTLSCFVENHIPGIFVSIIFTIIFFPVSYTVVVHRKTDDLLCILACRVKLLSQVIWERTKQNTRQTLPIATDLDLQDNINYGMSDTSSSCSLT